MKNVKARVTEHKQIAKMYRLLSFQAPQIADCAQPGQFVYLRVPTLAEAVLRRPFSIFDVDLDYVSILYKVVGKGTKAMEKICSGNELDVMGPLGNGFPLPTRNVLPVLVAGGYGIAPLHFLARRLHQAGICFIGASSKEAILCIDKFKKMGWKIIITTEDGSVGRKGIITDALKEWIERHRKKIKNSTNKIQEKLEIYACGPEEMLYVVGTLSINYGYHAWLSIEAHMGCGVGACLGCVHKVRLENGQIGWAKICSEGPVLESRRLIIDNDAKGTK